MSKLTIPSVPTFKTNLPSNNKEVSFRPYTVREESFLLQAKEVGNEKEIIDIIFNLLENCVIGVDASKLPIIDIEWLFLQIRIKSVGEEIEQSYRCTADVEGKKCNTIFSSFVNLHEVEVKGEVKTSVTFDFPTGTYKINFEQPTLKSQPKTEVEQLYQSINTIHDPVHGLLTKDDISLEDFTDFVQTFTNPQYENLKNAINEISTLYYKDNLRCPKCGQKTVKEYKSLFDFFLLTLSHFSLSDYYTSIFTVRQEHKWTITEIEAMLPWERDVYFAQINSWTIKKNEEIRNKQQ